MASEVGIAPAAEDLLFVGEMIRDMGQQGIQGREQGVGRRLNDREVEERIGQPKQLVMLGVNDRVAAAITGPPAQIQTDGSSAGYRGLAGDHTVASPFLCPIEGVVDPFEPGIQRLARCELRHPETGGDGSDRAERPGPNQGADPLRQVHGLGLPAVRHHHHEFLSAPAGQQIARSQRAAHPLRQLGEYLIPHLVTAVVVDRLEMVDVEQD